MATDRWFSIYNGSPDERLAPALGELTREQEALLDPSGLAHGVKWAKPELATDLATDKVLYDYLVNDIGARLCSERLRDIVCTHAAAEDDIEWLPVDVRDVASGALTPYWALRFINLPDLLDSRRTEYLNDSPRVLVYDREKLGVRHLATSAEYGTEWVAYEPLAHEMARSASGVELEVATLTTVV